MMSILEGFRQLQRPGRAAQNEWQEIQEAQAEVERAISKNRAELEALPRQVQLAARRNDLKAVSRLLDRRAALEAIIAEQETMRSEIAARYADLTRKAEDIVKQIEQMTTTKVDSAIAHSRYADLPLYNEHRIIGEIGYYTQSLIALEDRLVKAEQSGLLRDRDTGQIESEILRDYGRLVEAVSLLRQTEDKLQESLSKLEHMGYPLPVERNRTEAQKWLTIMVTARVAQIVAEEESRRAAAQEQSRQLAQQIRAQAEARKEDEKRKQVEAFEELEREAASLTEKIREAEEIGSERAASYFSNKKTAIEGQIAEQRTRLRAAGLIPAGITGEARRAS